MKNHSEVVFDAAAPYALLIQQEIIDWIGSTIDDEGVKKHIKEHVYEMIKVVNEASEKWEEEKALEPPDPEE